MKNDPKRISENDHDANINDDIQNIYNTSQQKNTFQELCQRFPLIGIVLRLDIAIYSETCL